MHGLAVIQLYVCNPDLYNQNCITDRTHAIMGDLRICYFHISLLQGRLCVFIGHLQGILAELSTCFLAWPFLFGLLPSSFHASVLAGLEGGTTGWKRKPMSLGISLHCTAIVQGVRENCEKSGQSWHAAAMMSQQFLKTWPGDEQYIPFCKGSPSLSKCHEK